jgi:hypothetical protein
MNTRLYKSLAPVLLAAALPALSPAALIHHWTLDGTLADSGSGAHPLVLRANSALSNDCSPVGGGSLVVNAATAPADGGAITSSPTNWSAFAGGDTRTVAFWMKATPGQEANATMFGAGTNSTGTRFDIKVFNNLFRVEIQGTGQTTATRVDTGRWHHVAVVLPNSASTMQNMLFYIDGASVPNASTSAAAVNTATGTTRIGDSFNTATDRDFNGHLDDIRVYDNALTPTEVQDLFNAGRLARCFATDDDSIITASPTFLYGTGATVLAWTSSGAKRIQISNGVTPLATYTLGSDGQPLLDAGSYPAPAINATTTYTISAWLDEAAAGTPATLQTTVTVQPAPDFTLHVSPPFTTAGTPVTLNWNATVVKTNAATGTFELFAALPTDPLTDNDTNFSNVLQSGTTYYMEVTNGTIAGATTRVTSWTGNNLFVADNFSGNSSWTTYRVFTQSGTDKIVIHDGTSNIATITDPLQIAAGSLVVDPGPSATTTFTGTASITGATASAVDTATVTVGGPATSNPAVILAAGPLAYYRFEENAGSPVFYDSSGNGRHSVSTIGTVTRAVPGPLGTCADFNNNGTVTTPVTLNPQDPDGDDTAGDIDPDGVEGWSLEILMRPEVAARIAGGQNIFSNQDGGGLGRSVMFLDPNGRLASFVGNLTSPNALAISNTNTNTKAGDLDWCHTALTYTLDVDGQTLTFSVEVIEAAFITAVGTDNGSGFPFITAGGLASGVSYQLRVSDDLVNWTNTGTAVIGGPSGTATFADTTGFDPVLRPKRFYRIVYLEP